MPSSALILYAFCFTVLLVRNRCGSMNQLKRLGVSVLAGVCAVVVCWGCTEGIWAGMQHMAVGTVIEEPDAIERSQEGDVSNNRFEIWRDLPVRSALRDCPCPTTTTISATSIRRCTSCATLPISSRIR